mmetsp:Transcript_8729/g.14840  ORF Transcript_8729/g.14840 Transcript_8729/m.14840 type:complete len:767 (+) Transcript_8729:102-2402(+)
MAAKINDGLFIGDFDTSQDVEFLELNKISSLINLAGKQLPNIFASHGIVYMTVDWDDREDFELFPCQSMGGHNIAQTGVIKEMVHFIDKCQKHGTSVLLFSVNGTGRCAVAASCYLMCKYGWGFEKSYDFLFAKKPDLELNRGFVEQLFKLDKDLRRQRYQSLHNISALENERLTGWNVEYVNASLSDNPSPAEEAMAIEETLMVNSFNNSKLTITTLPGPYESAMRQFKNFKLQFNLRRNQEAGVHLKRTNPKASNYRPPQGGILKGGRTHCPPHLRPGSIKGSQAGSQSPSSPSNANSFAQSRGSSNSRRVLEDSSDDEDYAGQGSGRRGQGHSSSPGGQNTHQYQESKRGRESPQNQDDSLMFGGSISLLSAGKDTTDSLYDDNQLHPSDSSEYLYDRPYQPQESMQSQNSQGSDLYDFVGLQSSSKTSSNYMDMVSIDSRDDSGGGAQPPRRREAKDSSRKKNPSNTSAGGFQDRRVRRSDAKQSAPPPSSRATTGATPEERLHSLLGDLQRGGGSKKASTVEGSSRGDTRRDGGTSYESSSKQRADRGYRSEAKRAHGDSDTGRQGTTVHDVANMNIQPAYYQNGMSVTGQPVVAKPHTTAWGEQTAPSNDRARVQNERRQKTASSKQYRSNTAGSTYRRGSPAPQVPAGGLSGRVKSSRESGGGSAPQRGGGSSQGLRRHGSSDGDRDRGQGGPRYSTPTRASSRQDSSGSTSSARRGTPTRERQSTPSRDRQSTPNRERNPTPTRQRPSTPDRSRGWKY